MRATTFDSAAAGAHPDLDRWIAYHAGTTGEGGTDDLQDHLASCRECTGLVLDLEAFADPAAADRRHAVSEFEQATAWRAFRPRLAPTKKWLVPATLAASFLAAAVGLAGWLQQQREADGLRREIAVLTRPQANVPIHDLYLGTTLRGPASDPAIEVPAGAASVTLILNELTETRGDELRARVLDDAGSTAATVEGLVLDEVGVATLGLSRGTLDSGDYLVRVEALRDGAWTPVGDYPLRLRFQ